MRREEKGGERESSSYQAHTNKGTKKFNLVFRNVFPLGMTQGQQYVATCVWWKVI